MAIERTANNLASFCLSVLGAPYWFACFGNVASESLYNSKRSESQNKKYYDSWPKSTFTDDYGKRVTDCAGLVKWFLWSNNMTDKAPTYKASEDFGATTFYNKCTEKGKIASIPVQKVGILVFKGNDTTKTHMGVVVDNNGTVVEAKGHAYGTVKSKVSDWQYWGKCHLIKYDDVPPSKDTYTVTTQYQPLTVRKEPTTNSANIGELAKGSSFTSTTIVKGESINGCDVSGYYLTPTPTLPPTPTPTPTEKDYRVRVNTFLAVRSSPENLGDKNKVGELYNEAVVTVYEKTGSWVRITGQSWVCADYLEPI